MAQPAVTAGSISSRLERDTLYSVIGVIASSPVLSDVLGGVVDLLTEATDCHACFIYLREGDRLRIRAASQVFADAVGRVEMGLDEGLTGWVARHKVPAFIREGALADARMKYVPELEEERFQSMVAVPVPARSGEVIGVVVLHTEAPREFDESVLTFLVHTASLVAGAIENAQLYEDARRRVAALTLLASLSRDIAAVPDREELYRVVTGGARALLRGHGCQLYLLDAEAGRLQLAAADPPDRSGVLLGAEGRPGLLSVPVVAGDRQLGVLAVAVRRALQPEEEDLLRAVANQAAVALEKAGLIERLTAENIVRDMFDAFAGGRADVAEARAHEAGCDLTRAHVFAHAELARAGPASRRWPAAAERTEAGLRRIAPGAFCDVGSDALRALVPLPVSAGEAERRPLRRLLDELGRAEHVVFGLSGERHGAAHGSHSLREAADAAMIARTLSAGGGALAYEDLGAYRYLVHLRLEDAPRDRQWDGVERLRAYDRRRGAHLVDTLERYLEARRSATTAARALYIHPNTLRQRLDRIEQLSGLDLATEDLLSLQLAIKLVRLRTAGEEDPG
jgi:GAF domain-containing protein